MVEKYREKPVSRTKVCVGVCFFLFSVRGFETEEEFEDFVKTDPHSGKVLAAVVFENTFLHDDEPLPLEVMFWVESESQFMFSVCVWFPDGCK